MNRETLERYAEAAVRACEQLGGNGSFWIGPPAVPDDVTAVEHELGVELPRAFRSVIIETASSFDLTWSLWGAGQPPFKGIFAGGARWDLERLVAVEEGRREWVRAAFPDENDPYDRVWHRKLGIQRVPNGDMLGLDLSLADAPLVYLSHDDGEGHGFVLGANFEDAFDRWLRLGCVGAEDWQWLPFVSGRDSGLDPDGENAVRWRQWFGIDRYLS